MNIETNSIGKGKGCARNQQTTQFCAEAVSLLKELDAANETIRTMEIRHSAAMLHAQTNADEYNAVLKERDEARKECARWKLNYETVQKACAEKVEQRDEARACLREGLQNSEFSEWVGVTIWHRWRAAAKMEQT